MEPFRDDSDLTAELSALRPTPRPAFAAELDERAAAGFPRRSTHPASAAGRLAERLRAIRPRRLLIPAGATALAAVAAVTTVVAIGEPEGGNPAADRHFAAPGSTVPAPGIHEFSTGFPSGRGTGSPAVKPQAGHGQALPASKASSSASGESSAAVESAPGGTGPFASETRHREVERSAQMVLGADPAEVAGDAAEVFDAVHAAGGIVLGSSVSGGAAGDAGARFDLLIPSAKLGDALADFSAIGTVLSRHEATADITAPTVRLGEQIRDSRATIDGLLVQLAGADSGEERAEVEAELGAERRHAAALRSRATKLDRRANLSRVSLRIETGAGSTSPAGESAWGVGDALGDAGHILGIAAAVTIVGLAILAPLALIALLAWLVNRARIRRGREHALD